MAEKGVVFDFESTIADLRGCQAEAFSTAFKQFKIPYDESKLDEYITTPLDVIFGKYYKGCTCKYRDFVIMYMGAFDRVIGTAGLCPGIEKTLRDLHSNGIKVGIISNTCEMYVHMILSKFDVDSTVTSVVGIERTPVPRPDPYSLKLCISELGLKPEEIRVISKSPEDRKICESCHIGCTGEL